MKLLALESSAMTASVAIVSEELVIAEYTIDHKKTHSQTLLAMVDEMLQMAGIDLQEISGIAVSKGPGSFTGLRIGSATAKGLGLALGKPLISVPTMDAMAYNIFGSSRLICPMLDARRTQVYTGLYSFEKEFCVIREQDILLVKDLVEELNQRGQAVIFLGDGVEPNKTYLEEHLKVAYSYAPISLNRSKAASVGALGMALFQKGQIENAAQFLPEYLRATQAERELLQGKEA